MASGRPPLSPLDQISQALSNPQQSMTLNIARDRANEMATGNPVLTDRTNLSSLEFINKYGSEVESRVNSLDNAAYAMDANLRSNRSALDIITDNVGGVASGFNQGVGSILTGATRLATALPTAVTLASNAGLEALGSDYRINDLGTDLVQGVSEGVDSFMGYTKGGQSSYITNNMVAEGIKSELDKADNNAQYERDIKTDGNFYAGLKYAGRDFLNNADRIISSPAALEQGTGQAVGSLLTIAPISRALQVANGLSATANAPLGIGLLEGSSAYQGLFQEIIDTPHEKLMETSPEYRNLIASNVDRDTAKQRIANSAATVAASIQGPIGAVTGQLVDKIEAAPFAANTVRGLLQNIGRETLEEGVQSVTGQASENIAKRAFVDPNQSLIEGVGSSLAEGAVFGSLSTGVTQAPSTALKAARDNIKSGVNSLVQRGDRVLTELESGSPVSQQNVQEVLNNDVAKIPDTINQLTPLVQNETEQDILNRFENNLTVTSDDLISLSPNNVQKFAAYTQGTIPNKFDALMAMAQVVIDPNVSENDKLSAATFIAEQQSKNKELFYEDLPKLQERLDINSDAYSNLRDFSQTINAIDNIPEIKQALQLVTNTKQTLNEDSSDPQVMRNTANIAKLKPQNTNKELLNEVLYQNTINNNLTPKEVKVIEAAVALHDAVETQTDIAPEERMNIVSQEIETTGGLKTDQLSLAQHLEGINQAYASNDIPKTQKRLENLVKFAQHMTNKVEALNKSIEAGNGSPRNQVSYKTLGSGHSWVDSKRNNSVFVDVNNPKSVALANRIYSDAKVVNSLANNLINVFSAEITLNPVPLPALVLNKVQEQPSVSTEQVTPVSEVQPTITQETPVETVSEPVVETPVEPEVQKEQVSTPTQETKEQPKAVTEPETKTTEEVNVVSEPEQKTEFFGNLINRDNNYFIKSFKQPKVLTSRSLLLDNPISNLKDMIDNPQEIDAFVGENNINITREQLSAYKSLLNKGETVRQKIKNNLKKFAVENEKLMKEFIEGTQPVNRFVRGKMLNILDRTNTGVKYNTQLLDTAIIGSLDWVLNTNQSKSKLDANDVAEILEMDEGLVDTNTVTLFNSTISLDQVKQALGEKIVQFWGVRKNQNEDRAYLDGIPQGLAAEVLQGLQDAGLIEMITFTSVHTKKTPIRIKIIKDSEILQELRPVSEFLKDVLLVNPDKEVIRTEPGKERNIPKYQMRNTYVENTPDDRRMINNAQQIPFKANEVFINFIERLGKDNYVKLMGGRDLTGLKLNKKHKESIGGINLSLNTSYDNVIDQVNQLRNQFDNINDANVYYLYNVSKVGRLQMLGNSNPQSDKLARHVFMPTQSTLDLTDPLGTDAQEFWMTVGQGLGLKTEKKSRQDIMTEAQALTMNADGEFYSLVQSLSDWVNDQSQDFPEGFINNLNSVLGSKVTDHMLLSLIDVANYQKAIRDNTLSNYNHFNYLEADGKTNGPINALMMFASGMFTTDWLRLVAKGGSFIGENNKTLNTLYYNNEDTIDLYETISSKINGIRNEFVSKLSKDHISQYTSLNNLLVALNVDISFNQETGAIDFKRGVAKNPLTVSIYGSGLDGIVSKITNELMGVIYETMSESLTSNIPMGELLFTAEGQPYGQTNFSNDLQKMLDYKAGLNQKGELYLSERKDTKAPKRNRENFEFTPKEYENLHSNMKEFFVRQLQSAIDSTVKAHVGNTTEMLQKASQIQSIFAHVEFKMRVQQRLADKLKNDPNFRKGDYLSPNEEKEIMDTVRNIAPIYSTGSQTFFVGGAETSEISSPDAFSGALDGKTLRTPAKAFAPTLAGVKVIPGLTIGLGDGSMIQRFINTVKKTSGYLPVFDGINMPANQIDNLGKIANESVYETWLQNPITPVKNSYKGFLDYIRNNDLTFKLNEELKEFFEKEIAKVYFNTFKPETVLNMEDTIKYVISIYNQLSIAEQNKENRNKVMKEVSWSIDQMASAESPYTQKGVSLAGMAYEEKAEYLNSKLLELSKSEFTEIISQEDITEVSNGFSGSAKEVSIDALSSVLSKMKKDPVQRDSLKPVMDILTGSGYKVVFGNADEINTYDGYYNPDRMDGNNDYQGKIDPVTKTIYIQNTSTETVVHELIHAATFEKTVAFFDGSSLSQEDIDAFTRLEGLMGEFMEITVSPDNAAYDTFLTVANVIQSHLDAGRKAHALNEFMAWSLSNQELANLQKEVKVQNKFNRVIGKALKALKELIWGKGRSATTNNRLFNNIRFNTRIVLATSLKDSLIQDMSDIALYQSNVFGNNQRLTDLRVAFGNTFNKIIKDNPLTEGIISGEQTLALLDAQKVSNEFIARGFSMNMQEKTTFEMLQAALSTDIQLNPVSLTRIQDLYDHVIGKLSVNSFMSGSDLNDQADVFQATEKLNALKGVYLSQTDREGRSNLLSSFLALSMVNEDFRTILAGLPKPESMKNTDRTLDAALENFGTASLNTLSNYLVGNPQGNVLNMIDALTLRLNDINSDQRSFIEQYTENGMDKIDNLISTNLNKLSDNFIVKAGRSTNPLTKTAGKVVEVMSALINEKRADIVATDMISYLNQSDRRLSIRELISEIAGRTSENASLFDLISPVRSVVQQTRQQFRENVPQIINSKFKRKLDQIQSKSILFGLGKTDFASIQEAFGTQRALELVSDNNVLNEQITSIEDVIKGISPNLYSNIFNKAQQLATYMNTNVMGVNLLSNAYLVANLFGETNRQTASETLVNQVDQLVSLYAMRDLNQGIKNDLIELTQNENEGMSFVLSYLSGLRKSEKSKFNTEASRTNYYKGYINIENQLGSNLIVANVNEETRLLQLGYTKLANYEGSLAEYNKIGKAYYYAPVSGSVTYNQGVLQTVHQTYSGVDPRTGFTIGRLTAGNITNADKVRRIALNFKNDTKTSEPLRAVYDSEGNITAFERSVDPKRLGVLDQNTDVSLTIGAWRGRQVEEFFANTFNEVLVNTLNDKWLEDKAKGRADEYINIAKSKDPIHQDSWKIVPREVKDFIFQEFGKDRFMVRKDMINDAIGARSASVGDLFTGNTRWKPAIQEEIKKAIIGAFGLSSYNALMKAEEILKNTVTDAKVLIVVKSIVVPAANLVSNIYQMLLRGVPVRNIFRGLGQKTIELNDYIKRKDREVKLETDLFIAQSNGNVFEARKIETQIRAIKDSYKRMSIWPLIEAGEFASISEGGISQEDLALSEGRWSNLVEKVSSKLPKGMQTPYNYAMITKDTALFKGLARAVQYGDFLGKAILYDDLKNRKKMTKQEALAKVSEEFINYNRFAGRSRSYFESIGLIWFWNFKLRSIKVAASMMRENPFRAFLMTWGMPTLPGIGNIGSPITDNFVSVLGDGSLGHSIGPGMGLNAPQLNPWVNIIK